MNKYCIWKCGEWCQDHDLPHRIEEYGVPDLEFTLPFQLPYPVEQAFMSLIVGQLVTENLL